MASLSCVCMVVMDGWGIAPPGPGNAIGLARTPVFDELWASNPHAALAASGAAVGLPDGQMGNSEVGHLTLGAGAVVPQTLTLINDAVSGGELASNEVIRTALTAAGRVHLVGLVSDGGVHSGFEHLRALIELAGSVGVPDLVVHCFTDGRDTLPTGGEDYLRTVDEWCRDAGVGRIASVVGRYYGMDRDQRWERVQAAYDLLVHGRGEHAAAGGSQAAGDAYSRGETDEFITATAVGSEGRIGPEDSVLCFNFRPDRMREIVRALAEPGFGEGAESLPGWRGRGGASAVRSLATMTGYQQGWPYPVAFRSARAADTLGAVIARAGASQLHVAETEKYAHVTYFFNGGKERVLPGEQRALVPSQRDVPTYDLKPQMSGREVAAAFGLAFATGHPRFSVINFANADMVGHTGAIAATIAAVETVDECLGQVVSAVHAAGGACVITADHGNAEEMLGSDGEPSTAHSLNPVPLIVTASGVCLSRTGSLADVAPTVLELLDMRQPTAMTGHSLLEPGPELIKSRMRTIDDLAIDVDLDGARVLVRVDLNVPLDHGRVTDDSRIRAALPTIEDLRRRGAAIVLVSHLGRPHGVNPALSLRPVADCLAELTDAAVTLAPAVVGDDVRRMARALAPGAILLLENVRFEAGETVNDRELSESLAELADVFVDDAFGAAHRAHASTEGVAHLLPNAAGRLMERELQALHLILLDPTRPLVAVLGGAKVADKIGVVRRFLGLADELLIGGAMAFPFLAAQGHSIGASRCAPEDLEIATKVLVSAPQGRLHLPVDLVVAEAASVDAPLRTLDGIEVPEGWLGLDIGPRTSWRYAEIIRRAGTVFWNGPMGVFELEPFATGTRRVAEALATSNATTVAGGGETVAALRHLGLAAQITHVSTGGGAALELIEGRALPGVQALMTDTPIPALAGAASSQSPAQET